MYGTAAWSDKSVVDVSWGFPGWDELSHVRAYINDSGIMKVQVYCGNKTSYEKVYVTIQYTKTTDQATNS